MRLLHTSSFTIDDFTDVHRPPYAILSHTWSSREVTFADLAGSSSAALEHPAWPKISNAAARAKADGFDWIWVDSCCIDKASSAELSEAINSMFRWYGEAEVCYIFLVDYDGLKEGKAQARGAGGLDFERLAKCRWFTRGWTLQELIAPSSRVFLNANWEEIGRLDLDIGKKLDAAETALLDALTKITRIPKKVLVLSSTRGFSVAQKMSWASQRTTTRLEDMAYSLLGILGVNMPLLYGEGEKAFIRLQEEVLKKSVDHSLFAWTDERASRSTYRGLLARSPAEFESCGDVHFVYGKAEPYAMTNKGLHMKLPMEPVAGVESEFLAYLNTSLMSFQTRVCLRLAKLDDNGHYARVDANERRLLPTPEQKDMPLIEIFVLQDVDVHLEYHSPRVGTITFGTWAFSYPLNSLLPQDLGQTTAWTEASRTLSVPQISLGSPIKAEYAFTGDFELDYLMMAEFDSNGDKKWKIRWRNSLDPDGDQEQRDGQPWEDMLRYRFAKRRDGTNGVSEVLLRQRAAIIDDELTLVLGKLGGGGGFGGFATSRRPTGFSKSSTSSTSGTWLSSASGH
jgi:hypothetical protein